MGNDEGSRKVACERGLAGPGSPKYQNALTSSQGGQWIALILLVRCGTVRRRAGRNRRLSSTSKRLSGSVGLICFSLVCHILWFFGGRRDKQPVLGAL